MYDLTIDYISFISYSNQNLMVRGNTDIGNIPLELDVSVLDEVEVRAERTQVEIRLDKKIYNVGQDITVKGGNVSDVLANIPSIDVDFDGNISLRGNSNVRILINGKPSGLVGLSGPQGLRSLPSESIEKVEVVTSPSARYSAEGTAGILNIILKKQNLLGFNGNFNVNLGIPKNEGINGTLNVRNEKVNLFGTVNLSNSENSGTFFSETNYTRQDLTIEETNDSDYNNKNIFFKLGSEYYFSDNVLERFECHKFLEFLYKNVMRYVADLGYVDYDNIVSYEDFVRDEYVDSVNSPNQYMVAHSWFTRSNKGQYAPMHYHGSSDISGVYYLQTNGQDGNLTFYSPTKELISSFVYSLIDDKQEIPLEQGVLALWPGLLYHTTANNETDHERISLSFNIQFPRAGFCRSKIKAKFNGVQPH